MKRLTLFVSICILLLSSMAFAQTEMKVNRDINLLNNNITNANAIRALSINLNGKDLDSLISAYNIGSSIEADSITLGDTTTAGTIIVFDGDSGFVKLTADTLGLLNVNEKPVALKEDTDSLAADIAALAGYEAWSVDSLTLELTLGDPRVLRIMPSYIAQYELVSANNVKLALKAPLASPTFSGTVSIPSPFMLGGVMMQTNATRLNFLKTAIGTTGGAGSNVVFSDGPTFTGNVILPSTTTIGSVSSGELGFLDGVVTGIQAQLNNKLTADFTTYTYVEGPFTGDEYVPIILSGINVVTAVKFLPIPLAQDTVNDALAAKIEALKTFSYEIQDPSSGRVYTLFRTKAAITIDSIFVFGEGGGTSTTDFSLDYGTSRGARDSVFSGSQRVYDTNTEGNTFLVGDMINTSIPINNMVWLDIEAVANAPKEFMIYIYYH